MRRSLLALSLIAMPLGIASAAPCPTVMLVLDQSLSMAEDVDGNPPDDPNFHGPSKWALLQQVVEKVVNDYGDHVPFGLELFSTDAWRDQLKCEQSAQITVEVSHSSAPEIKTQLSAAMPKAETDTGEAIKRAAEDPNMNIPGKQAFILLVTDGEPNCNPIDLRSSVDPTAVPQYTIDQIAAAAKAGIKTYVVGFDGKGVKPISLDNMAYAGGTRKSVNCGSLQDPPEPCYYQAGKNAQEFSDVLEGLVSQFGGEFYQICDDSCYTLGCGKGQICITDEIQPDPHCVNDPCGGRTCSGSTFCRGGGCIQSCKDGCPDGTSCQDGKCVEDKCAGQSCGAGKVCNPNDGTCIDFPCAICTRGAICDVASGRCVVDQCNIITCPEGMKCVNNGNCQAPPGGVSGCHATGQPHVHGDRVGLIALAAALVSLAMIVLRRRRRA